MGLDLLDLSAELFTAYLLLTGRVLGLFATMPLFGERTVPWQTKVGTAMLTAFLLLPLAHHAGPLPTGDVLLLALGFLREMLVGLTIGYLARLLFGAFQFAVNAIDFQMGLSFVQLVNPGAESSMSVLGQFLNTMMLMLFLELNGHHILLGALGRTVDFIPLGAAAPLGGLVEGFVELLGLFVAVSLQIALPTVLVLLLIDLAMGIIGRVVPQLNVFLVALPVKIMVGLATLWLTLPALYILLGQLLGRLSSDLIALLRMLY